jgi:pimeloyl-ACP methyl ester carboxylesterase
MTATRSAIAATDVGAGDPALLLVPGWCGGRDAFDALLEQASAHRRAISVDLPGHGDSPQPASDFGLDHVVDELVALVEREQLERVVPVALSHAGWAAVALRRRLGADRVPGLVLLDWMVLGTPPGFAQVLAGLRSPAWEQSRDLLLSLWGDGVDVPALHAYLDRMARTDAGMWARAAREIGESFEREPVPLEVLDALACPTLHLYAQPADDGYLAAQQAWSEDHPWFRVQRLEARSHLPMFEVPDEITAAIEAFVQSVG